MWDLCEKCRAKVGRFRKNRPCRWTQLQFPSPRTPSNSTKRHLGDLDPSYPSWSTSVGSTFRNRLEVISSTCSSANTHRSCSVRCTPHTIKACVQPEPDTGPDRENDPVPGPNSSGSSHLHSLRCPCTRSKHGGR